MHVMDGGVTGDFLGFLFHLLLPHMPGTTIQQRIGSLFKIVVTWYPENAQLVDARLDNLTVGMIYPKASTSNSPRLNGQCAEIRSLVGFAPYASSKFFVDKDNVIEQLMLEASKQLKAMYDSLSAQAVYRNDVMRKSCKAFALHCIEAEKLSPIWRIKPKLHMMQEMIEMEEDCRPNLYWNYRNEDFGGAVVTMAKGSGPKTVHSTGQRILENFQGAHPVPTIK